MTTATEEENQNGETQGRGAERTAREYGEAKEEAAGNKTKREREEGLGKARFAEKGCIEANRNLEHHTNHRQYKAHEIDTTQEGAKGRGG